MPVAFYVTLEGKIPRTPKRAYLVNFEKLMIIALGSSIAGAGLFFLHGKFNQLIKKRKNHVAKNQGIGVIENNKFEITKEPTQRVTPSQNLEPERKKSRIKIKKLDEL